jgi:HEAT repeat protein
MDHRTIHRENKSIKCEAWESIRNSAYVLIVKSACAAIFLLWLPASMFAQRPVDRAWTILKSGLADKGFEQRARAARVLGLLEDNSQAEDLALKSLADEKPEVRSAAASALGQMKAKSAVPKLVATLKEEQDVSVVIAGARSLIALGEPLGYSLYYAVLTGEKKSGESLMDQQKKLLSDPKKMGQLGFAAGIGFVPFASIGYGAIKTLSKDDVSPVRAAAAKILAKDPDPKSTAALVEAASDKSWIVRVAAIDALSERGDSSVLPRIEPKMDDEKAAVRFTAAAAVIHLQGLHPGKTGQSKK